MQKKKLAVRGSITAAAAVVFVVLSVLFSRVFVFFAVILGIMAISDLGGAFFSVKAKQAPVKDLSKSPFALNEQDIKAQMQTLKHQFESGEIDEQTYNQQCRQLSDFIK